METKPRFIQFPLFLLRGMLTNKVNTINDIIRYGIYNYSTKFSYTIVDASKQFLYYYYRHKGDLTNYLLKTIETYIRDGSFDIDEDYNGFSGKTFEPEFEMEQLYKIFETDIEFKNSVVEFYKIHLTYQSLNIKGDKANAIKVGKEIEKRIPPKEPVPMVNLQLLFDFRDNDKSEFELIQFVAYIAVNSILGKKTFVKTNKPHIVCRMFGYSSVKHLPEKMPKEIKDLYSKYSNRYHIDKVLQFLELNWNVLTYSNNIRGMYIAMKTKISIKELAKISETKKLKTRLQALKQSKIDARNEALEQLNKGQQLNKD